jgi:hypothetical protein
MQSNAMYDLDASNNPILKLQVISSTDVRDKIAKRLIESLGHISRWCLIVPSGESEYIIFPLQPQELREQAAQMNVIADELESRTAQSLEQLKNMQSIS